MAKKGSPFSPESVVISGPGGRIWNEVSNSELFGDDLASFLKMVDYSERKYTSIDAYTQFKRATEVFGPFGHRWGIRDIEIVESLTITKQTRRGDVEGYQVLVKAKCWYVHGEGEDVISGESEIMEDIFLDTSGDSMKKITTGLLTKFLSYLGWNFDVFAGRFNDVKTFAAVASEKEQNDLRALCKKIKPGPAKAILNAHEKRGWLRDEVQADMRKINEALATKEESKEEGDAEAE